MSKLIKLFLAIFLVVSCSKKEETAPIENANLTIISSNGEKTEFRVEDASTPQELEQGLMGRDSIPAKTGMFFDLHGYKNAAMWMKDTKMPLDMIFVKDHQIVWIYENAEPMSTKTIICPVEFDSVIELNAGEVKTYNIKAGDKVEHNFLKDKEVSEGPVPEELVEEGTEVDIEEAEMPSDEEGTASSQEK